MPDLDAIEVGVQAARVMEDLERAAATDELGDEPRVVAAMVIYEVRSILHGSEISTVGLRVTDDRNVVGLGLVARARGALDSPDGDLAE